MVSRRNGTGRAFSHRSEPPLAVAQDRATARTAYTGIMRSTHELEWKGNRCNNLTDIEQRPLKTRTEGFHRADCPLPCGQCPHPPRSTDTLSFELFNFMLILFAICIDDTVERLDVAHSRYEDMQLL